MYVPEHTFWEKKSGGRGLAQHPVSSSGLIPRLTETLTEETIHNKQAAKSKEIKVLNVTRTFRCRLVTFLKFTRHL